VTGYAVIDVQTTGLEPSMHHRILEIAIIEVDNSGATEGSWCTLINPQRDVGATNLHGISARDVLKAPTFDDLVPKIINSLAGRTLVAHNAEFEVGFLEAELRRSGVPLSMPIPIGVPTMEWFNLVSDRKRRRLVDCCDELGIPLTQRYSSAVQANAVAELLRRYLSAADGNPPWVEALTWSRAYPWPALTSSEPPCQLMARASGALQLEASWLDRIASQMPSGGNNDVDAYLDVLEMAMLDRYLSAHEIDSLVRIADNLGLDSERTKELHHEYLLAMARIAWADGVVTDDESQDLAHVADMLGLASSDVANALSLAQTQDPTNSPVRNFRLRKGDSVCFTGTMTTPRELLEGLARDNELVVGGLSKSTRLVVAADPDSLSGKAKKARDYGIVIVNEVGFRSILGAT
jgi:DNA polymerase-3 subunit epsilon